MYIYIIECEDGSFYTGIAKDIDKRLTQHYCRLKPCAKYTKSHKMKDLKALWTTDTKQDACKLEYRIKKLVKSQKTLLIENQSNLQTFFKDKLDCNKFRAVSAEEQKSIIGKIFLS